MKANVWVGITGSAVLAVGCVDGMLDLDRILQGGDLTIFNNTSSAYDMPSPPVQTNPERLERFMNGDKLWGTDRVASSVDNPPPAGTGGLGPLYVGKSCSSCHLGGGRTKPTLFTHGGTGFDFSSFLVFLRTPHDNTFRDYGRVLHDHATFGAKPEGKLQVKYTVLDDQHRVCWDNDGRCDSDDGHCTKWLVKPTPTEPLGYCLIREQRDRCRSYPDGEPYCLLRPHYRLKDLYAGDLPREAYRMSVRTPLRHLGLGLLLAVDPDEIRALAAQPYPSLGISGKVQWLYEQGRWDIGLSGHKATHADLTVELGFSSDIGVTSKRFPEEVAQGQPQAGHDFGIEISTHDLADVDMYLRSTGVPARRNTTDPKVLRGEELFAEAHCNACHAPTLHTTRQIPALLDGTPMPMLADQTIHPYSDFLLHDMGPDLGDDYDQWEARGDEWRTAPLWGIGLQEIVSGHTHFLHDGRARTLEEAILWHFGEEGRVSTNLFMRMSKADRESLLAFLKSL